MAELLYGANAGCVAAVSGYGGTPHQCRGEEVAAVPHRFRYPRPHSARLYVCASCARDEPTAEPLTGDDRAEISRRYRRRAEQMARVTVGPHAADQRRPG